MAGRADRYHSKFSRKWRKWIWFAYHLGIVALLAGLGTALAPRVGAGTQFGLRWIAMWVAFAASAGELGLAVWAVIKPGQGTSKGKDGTDLASIDPPRRAARTRNRAGKSGTALLPGAGG